MVKHQSIVSKTQKNLRIIEKPIGNQFGVIGIQVADILTFSELISPLTVTEFKINIEGLDYIELDNKLKSTKKVITINSNFIHKAFEGYKQYLSKSKGERRCR
ncbi:hypothetical protein RhiirB3_425854 [Rhizophagus irregularis]|nr:hypothetical protein RhiirB3_425854 [Rhizophagus irregularis]